MGDELTPWIVLVLAFGVGGLIGRVARRRPVAPARAPKRAVRPAAVMLPRPAPLASASAGRAPPCR